MGFLAHTNVNAIIRCQSKWGLKIIQTQIHSFLGIRNELPWGMKPIRALIQKFRKKNSIYQECPNLCSGNKFYKRFQMTKLEDQYLARLIRRSKKLPTSIALLNGVNCKISIMTHEELHNTLRKHAGTVWIGTLKIIGVENTKVP